MANHRIDRISEEVKRVVSDIIRNDLNDPRISTMCSVVSAEVTADLRYAKVFVSILGSDEEKKATMKGLTNAAGFIRRELGRKIELRYLPEVIFELDRSIEHGAYINKLLNEVKKKDGGENL
ncbi:MAG TPA: 30S ribosome-binding factor RbfA [Bacillota bacterium]|nr:30S ribosome-binding factor RbfA [Clostridia bacterium]MDD3438473.1 30S ribosome-binding factor RbfA [Clostridiaceae bacterium]HNR04006.1 30S ribosome-binding factor RbfA [Bacillota bacterium]HNT02253.1 30S ribosome-binding factor RbfA [Bacillota bacterium]HNU80902.1 30S ribosome-binding factor RbfA [Bacillota bacterium]